MKETKIVQSVAQRFLGKEPTHCANISRMRAALGNRLRGNSVVDAKPVSAPLAPLPVQTEQPMLEKTNANKIIETPVGEDNMEDNKIAKLAEIVATDARKTPSKRVKRERKEKGLYERTSESTVILTEDNKQLLLG